MEEVELTAPEVRDMLFAGAIAQRFVQLGGDEHECLKVAKAARQAFGVVRASWEHDPLTALFDWLDVEDMEREMAK